MKLSDIFYVSIGINKSTDHCGLFVNSSKPYFVEFNKFQIKKTTIINNSYDKYFFLGVEKLNSKNSIKEDNLPAINTLIDLIIENNSSEIYYSFLYDGVTFDQSSGQLRDKSKGLTCVTFIVAFFETLTPSLIDYDNWPIRKEDTISMKEIIRNLLDLDFSFLSRIQNKTEVISCKRIRPSEISAAATFKDSMPANFSYCNEFGNEILQFLKK